MELRVDPARDFNRLDEPDPLRTGIPIRALRDGKWGNADVFELDRESLVEWVRSRGPVSDWAVSIIEILLLHEREE